MNFVFHWCPIVWLELAARAVYTTWDAENRLIRMVAATTVGPQQRIDVEYDAEGRRTRKTVWNNTAGSGSPASSVKFLYDGWNMVAELNTGNSVVGWYVWGQDVSGTREGAGGGGGCWL